MKKAIFAFLVLATIANLVILIIALTDESSVFYNYRFIIGIAFIMFGGFLTRHALGYRKNIQG
jgi:hypothetical protein